MNCSALQLRNACSPTSVTLSGILIYLRFVQPRNAFSEIEVMSLGTLKEHRLIQLEKSCALIDCGFTSVRERGYKVYG